MRSNIRLVFVAANNARKALTVDQNEMQLAQIRAAHPPVPPLQAARTFVCKKCRSGTAACTVPRRAMPAPKQTLVSSCVLAERAEAVEEGRHRRVANVPSVSEAGSALGIHPADISRYCRKNA